MAEANNLVSREGIGDVSSFAKTDLMSAERKRKYSDASRLAENVGGLRTDIDAQGSRKKFCSSILHSVPHSIIPIVHEPFRPEYFFDDLNTDTKDPGVAHMVASILKKFPPPIPPYLGNEKSSEGGIMVPFIFPPPPLVRSDYYDTKDVERDDSNYEMQREGKNSTEKEYVELPPLPFPPPNYMPYPLISDKAPLRPREVFDAFLQALQELPRSDMVLASAAGSLFDLRIQAKEEGYTNSLLESQKRRRKQQEYEREAYSSVDESNDDLDELGDSNAGDYDEYIEGIDQTEVFDKYQKPQERNTVEVNYNLLQDYSRVAPKTSDMRGKGDSFSSASPDGTCEELSMPKGVIFDRVIPSSTTELLENPRKDIAMANGSYKEKRREELLDNSKSLENYSERHRKEIYLSMKIELLEKLKNLKESKILVNDSDSGVKDEELLMKMKRLGEIRDERLLRLKIIHDHESFKSLLFCCRDLSLVQKNFNQCMTNKLLKLKNFFQFQKSIFENALHSKEENNNLFDIKNKSSSNMYKFLRNGDLQPEVKEILENTIFKELDAAALKTENISNDTSPVHDFMPLVTAEEFNIITGDLPRSQPKDINKHGQKAFDNARHQVFQSPLYDQLTSGSDTNNTSESGKAATPKRRGRRGAGAANERVGEGYDVSRTSESRLLAKIMKQYESPLGANIEECSKDFAMMNMTSRWPFQK